MRQSIIDVCFVVVGNSFQLFAKDTSDVRVSVCPVRPAAKNRLPALCLSDSLVQCYVISLWLIAFTAESCRLFMRTFVHIFNISTHKFLWKTERLRLALASHSHSSYLLCTSMLGSCHFRLNFSIIFVYFCWFCIGIFKLFLTFVLQYI